jgi:DNA-binding NarL/FixJ family response regulator
MVLLVEDHDGYRRVVRHALECFLPGWSFSEADGVQAAAEVLRTGGAGVLVCDLMLPDGTAADLVDQLRALDCGQTKVIVFSNHSEEALAPLRTRPQVHGCLTKEHGLKALAMMIQQTGAFSA